MEGTYDVYCGAESVGEVTVSRQGLYYRFSCRCDLTGEVMYDLALWGEDGLERLGLLTPMDGRFGLETRLPVKNLGQGKGTFRIQPRHSAAVSQFYPVRPEEPFAYLQRLENAFLASRDRQVGVVFADEK